jgi:hypothetical protein
MLLHLMVSLAMADASPRPHAGPPPDHAFWSDIIAHSGARPLSNGRALRLVRVPTGLITATIVTVEATGSEVRVDVRRVPDRRRPGASVQARVLSQDRYAILSDLARAGLWSQPATAPTGKPEVQDGVLWFLEGTRSGEHWALVRHEPEDAAVQALCAEIMRIAGDPEQGPRP